MPSSAPSWLTPQLLGAILRAEDEECGPVTSVRVRPATAANENYLSELLRVYVHLGKGDHVRQLIVKAVPSSEKAAALVRECGVFRQETRMLRETLPQLQLQLAAALSHRPAHHLQLGPSAFGVCPNGALVMEDLSEKGFRNVPRREGLDLPHSLVAVRLLARLHAASLVLHGRSEEDGRALEAYGRYWLSEELRPTFNLFLTNSLLTLATAAREWTSLGAGLVQRLERAAATAPERGSEAMSTKPGDFLVLCHGDPWSNNIMFDYDEETAQVRSARLVDFQLSHWGSPSLDLHYLLSLAASRGVRREWSSRLVRAYHAELSCCLAAAGWSGRPPTLAALQRDLLDREYWACVCHVCLLPIRYVAEGAALDTEAMVTANSPDKIRAIADPDCRAALEEALLDYDKKGFFD